MIIRTLNINHLENNFSIKINTMCPAPKKHEMWGNPVKPKRYTPEELWERSIEYFEFVDDNPWMLVEQVIKPQKMPKNYNKRQYGPIKNYLNQIILIPKAIPYTIKGLCNYLNISLSTFKRYSNDVLYETHWPVSTRVREIIYAQQLTGAMSGFFNSRIVMSQLGLANKKEISIKEPLPIMGIIISDPEKLNSENDNL